MLVQVMLEGPKPEGSGGKGKGMSRYVQSGPINALEGESDVEISVRLRHTQHVGQAIECACPSTAGVRFKVHTHAMNVYIQCYVTVYVKTLYSEVRAVTDAGTDRGDGPAGYKVQAEI